MTTEDRARFEVLLESVETSVRVIAEGHLALSERLDRMEAKLDGRFEQIDTRFMQIDTRFMQIDTRFTQLEAKLDVFSIDTRRRLERIETHLGLDGPRRPQRSAAKRRKAA